MLTRIFARLIRSFGNGNATNAMFNGDHIAITTTKGKTDIEKIMVR